jgi:hypothetical protein
MTGERESLQGKLIKKLTKFKNGFIWNFYLNAMI